MPRSHLSKPWFYALTAGLVAFLIAAMLPIWTLWTRGVRDHSATQVPLWHIVVTLIGENTTIGDVPTTAHFAHPRDVTVAVFAFLLGSLIGLVIWRLRSVRPIAP